MARVTLVIAVVASLAAATPAARAAGGCEVPKRAQVLKRSATAVVYRTGSRVEGCLNRVGEPVYLASVGPDENGEARLGPIALAGPYAAWAMSFTNRNAEHSDKGVARVRRADLRSQGRQVGAGSQPSPVMTPTVPRLVMARDGSIAFTLHWLYGEPPSYPFETRHSEVRTFDAFGHHFVDDSPDLDLRSLERRGRVVSWLRGGDRYHTRLDGTGRCRIPAGARLKAGDFRVVVYAVRRQRAVDLVACSPRDGKHFVMATESRSGELFEAGGKFRAAGRYIAWREDVRDGDDQRLLIRVYDVVSREFVRSETIYEQAPRTEKDVLVPGLVLTVSGDVAWTQVIGQEASVEAWDACGRRRLDGDEEGVDPESLRLRGRIVSWAFRYEQRSAELRSAGVC